jgi:putative FmdB family regulatory protein
MPLYEYRCRDCEHFFEVLQGLGESGEHLACPRCEAVGVERQLSTFAGMTASSSSAESCSTAGCDSPFT